MSSPLSLKVPWPSSKASLLLSPIWNAVLFALKNLLLTILDSFVRFPKLTLYIGHLQHGFASEIREVIGFYQRVWFITTVAEVNDWYSKIITFFRGLMAENNARITKFSMKFRRIIRSPCVEIYQIEQFLMKEIVSCLVRFEKKIWKCNCE